MPLKEMDLFYEPPIELREQVKKDLTYTVKVIGGQKEYDAYMVAKHERLAERAKAQHEAYLNRRIILEGIVLGEAQASPEAFIKPATIYRFQSERLIDKINANAKEMATPRLVVYDTPKPPNWLRKIKAFVSRALFP